MGAINIKVSIDVNVPKEKVWAMVAEDFVNVANWASGVNTSVNNPDAAIQFEGAPSGGRLCQVEGFGQADERILVYDPSAGKITWSAEIEKAPGFVKNLKNNVTIESTGENSTKFTTNITAEASGIMGFFMGGMMKKNFEKLLKGFVKDVKVYAETGVSREDSRKDKAA